MDRGGRGKPPSGEFSSFDLSKVSEAEVAAELAARMARWRQARKAPGACPDTAARQPPAGKPTARPTAAQVTIAEPPARPYDAGLAIAARIDRARRIATQGGAANGRVRPARQAPPYGAAFESVLAEGPNSNAVGRGPEHGADHAPPPERLPGLRAEEGRSGSSRASKMRALSGRLPGSIDQALTKAGALGARTQAGGLAAWRRLKPALEARMDQALVRARARGARAQEAAMAAWRTRRPALEARMHQALRGAYAIFVAADRAVRTARRASGPLLVNGIGHTRRHARAIAAAAMQARTDRFALAGLAAIAFAIAGWLAVMIDDPTPPDVARSPEGEHPRAIARASAAPELSQIPPPREIARLPQPRSAPNVAVPDAVSHVNSAPLPARLKPTPRAPMLAARLKPDTAQPATPTANRQATAEPTTGHFPNH